MPMDAHHGGGADDSDGEGAGASDHASLLALVGAEGGAGASKGHHGSLEMGKEVFAHVDMDCFYVQVSTTLLLTL